jgi:pterin-4a-carbinolamine dehydratase
MVLKRHKAKKIFHYPEMHTKAMPLMVQTTVEKIERLSKTDT